MADAGLEPTRERVGIALVIGVLCIAAGGYLTYDAVATTASAEEVDAVVLESSVDGVSGTERDFRVHVSYEYTYGDETYTNDNVFAEAGEADRFDNRGTAESFVADYSEGEMVTAHVDPDDPTQAYLESGIRVTSLLGYAVLILVGVVAVAAGLKQGLSLARSEG